MIGVAFSLFAAIVVVVPRPAGAGGTATPPPAPGQVSDRLVVRVRKGASAAQLTAMAHRVGGQVLRIRADGTSAVVRVNRGQSPAVAARLSADAGVAWAEPDHRMRIADEPSDPCYQKALGCPAPGNADQDNYKIVHAPQAWSITKGDPNLTVAVLDTIVDTSHVDLQGKVRSGPTFLSDPSPLPCPSDAQDAVNHGTHVAGIIAASTDNRIDVAGLGWNTRALAIRVLDDCGVGLSSDIADGIRAAAGAGARVMNMSLTGDESLDMRDAIAAAEAQGVVMVAAAGNSGNTDRTFPAAYPGVVGVAATTRSDQIASFSSRGSWVELAAPGTNIWSTLPANQVGAESGTSMAAPHVAAVAALVMAIAPSMTGPDVVATMARQGFDMAGGSPEDFAAFIRDDLAKWERVASAAGLKR